MKSKILLLLLAVFFLLTGCAGQEPGTAPDFSSIQAAYTEAAAETAVLSPEQFFSSRDLEAGYDLSKVVRISLEETGNGTLTIDTEGVYLLSGMMENGQIMIDAGKNDKVQLVLDGASIHCESSAAIYCKKADKVFLTLTDGSENTLSCGSTFLSIDDNNIDAALFAKTDLTLNGSGSLTVISPGGHGVVSKDSLVITGGSYDITAGKHGITGKDSIAISAGNLSITSGKDGIHAKNAEDSNLGCLYISGGSFLVESGEDAVSATGAIQIDGGEFHLKSGGGSSAVTMRPSDFAGGFRGGSAAAEYGTENSSKGIKSDASIQISAGSFRLDCADDGVHAGGDILISGGQWEIRTADDGIHSDSTVELLDGEFHIPYCYEGIEGMSVAIDGGSFTIRSCDDGINAAGGMDSSGFEALQKGGSAVNTITVNGGSITIESDGDCLDSNGSLILNGGTLNLTCNGNGNTALDCDGSFRLNGADVTTNDGSENNPGQMGGGRGFGGFENERGSFEGGKGGFGGQGARPFGNGEAPPEMPEGMTPPRMPPEGGKASGDSFSKSIAPDA